MYFARDIEKELLRQIGSTQNRITLLSGARQTGKTTIVENLPTDRPKRIINFWDETTEITALKLAETFELFEKYLFQFFKFKPDGSTLLIIDEAQASPSLGRYLMQMHRTWPKQRVVLLGSILSNLVRDNMPMPAGRVVELVCRPLNFIEFLRFKGKDNYLELLPSRLDETFHIDVNLHNLLMAEYETFLQIGGLPGIVNAFVNNEDCLLLFDSLLNNYYRDADRYIYQETDITRSRVVQYGSLMEHCMKTIAQHIAFPTQNSTIVSTDSPSYRSVLPKVLEALRAWHIAYFVQNETKQQTTKKGYSSKKYLFDTGVANLLLNHLLPVSLKAPSELNAQLLENAVLQELVSRTGNIRRITSYKNNNKAKTELDFLVRYRERIIPIEVKCAVNVNQKALSQMLTYLEDSKRQEGVVVYTGQPQIKKISGQTLHFIPPYYLPLWLDHSASDRV